MKRIIILGAKPGAQLVNGDMVYCANASFLSQRDKVAKFSKRIIVASSLILAKGLREDVANHDTYKKKIDAVNAFGADRLVLFSAPGKRNYLKLLLEHLVIDEKKTRVRQISVFERMKLVRDIGEVSYPVIDSEFHTQPLGVRLKDRIDNLKCAMNWKFGDQKKDVRAKYRPSTGILALLVAIEENGPDAEYIMCGIGIQDRNIYKLDGETVSVGKNRSSVLPRHTRADIAVLKSLSRTYHISSTEPELHSFVSAHDPRTSQGADNRS